MTDIAIYAEATINKSVNAIEIDQCRLHSANPGTNNANEISSPDYVRQPCSFALAIPGDQGRRYLTSPVQFELTANDEVRWVSFWFNGSFVEAHKLPVDRTFVVDGKGTLTTSTYISSRGVTVL